MNCLEVLEIIRTWKLFSWSLNGQVLLFWSSVKILSNLMIALKCNSQILSIFYVENTHLLFHVFVSCLQPKRKLYLERLHILKRQTPNGSQFVLGKVEWFIGSTARNQILIFYSLQWPCNFNWLTTKADLTSILHSIIYVLVVFHTMTLTK